MRTSECVLNLQPLRQRFRKLWRTKRRYCAPHVPTEVTRLTVRLLEGVEPSRHDYISRFLTKRKSSVFLLSGRHFDDFVLARVRRISFGHRRVINLKGLNPPAEIGGVSEDVD